uniref:Protein kinase domain-containing protein n=1 Tax=Strigamia maritima TaxID=126957 RepID=T1IJ09_STRMM
MGCGNSKSVQEKRSNAGSVLCEMPKKKSTNRNSDNMTVTTLEHDLLSPLRRNITIQKVKYNPKITEKYDVKSLIGKGAYSYVVRVQHRMTRQYCAMKIIKNKKGFELLERELCILTRVKHPNIIQLNEILESNGSIAMVMELATGGDLFDRIVSRGNFTEKDAIRVLYMVLDGIQYLHSLGITHRDLKPDNLLYQRPGNDSKILITDFGLASTRKSGDTFMSTACGTPEYIAPEIILRKPYTNLVDMWAIGVIAFIMLSGKFPFEDDSHARLYTRILRAKYSYRGQSWSEVSNSARDFINRLLTVEPTLRMTATEALMHSWLNPHTDDKVSSGSS